jgi:membrane associated rhomboid family serine protease
VGALDPAAMFGRHEWWRPATALFLHGDASHLLSNALAGIFVFSAVLGSFGQRIGWVLLAVSAIIANLSSAALPHPGPYVSVGASTAIFAGLGLLSGRAAARVRHRSGYPRWRGVFVPLGAGLILFALWGAGGPRVDLGAHVCGFVVGLIAGAVYGAFGRRP